MRSFLLQPYPFSENLGRKLALCASIGAFIALFLGIFKPFGFDELQPAAQRTHAFFFGLLTFVVSAFFQAMLPKIFPTLFKEESWRSWKEIVYLLITTCGIGTANYLLVLYLYPQPWALSGFFRSQLNTLEIGVFPVLFVVFMKQMTLYRRFPAEATEDIQHTDETPAQPRVSVEPSLPAIVLRGDNQNEEFKAFADDLLFIASADNYINVHCRQEYRLTSTLLRSSLKKIEEQLADYPQFFRCHRMYLVNLRAVTAVSGNAQGLRLHFADLNEVVPVSRSLTETVKEKLHRLSHSPQNTLQ